MKFGVADYGMNVWYGGLYDIEDRLQALKKLGFEGIERIEAVSTSDALNKATLYRRNGMGFCTCRGPNTQANFEWSCGLGCKYVWLTPGDVSRNVDIDVFIRRANAMVEAGKKYGLKVALHNHMQQRIENQDELDRFMKDCPDAGLLLDCGHLSAAGGDVLRTIDQYHDRLCAVHVKGAKLPKGRDENGRAIEWRFCELGAGDDGLDNAEVIRKLRDYGYDGWVMIEHDTHLQDPLVDLKISLDFMKNALVK